MAFVGTILMTGALLWDTIIWPILNIYDPSFFDFNGLLYTSNTFVPFFIFSGIIYNLGYVILGIAIAKSPKLLNWPSIMISFGAPLFGLGLMFGKAQVYPRSIGITLFGLGLIWIGYLLGI